jgi:hypothetical protein
MSLSHYEVDTHFFHRVWPGEFFKIYPFPIGHPCLKQPTLYGVRGRREVHGGFSLPQVDEAVKDSHAELNLGTAHGIILDFLPHEYGRK